MSSTNYQDPNAIPPAAPHDHRAVRAPTKTHAPDSEISPGNTFNPSATNPQGRIDGVGHRVGEGVRGVWNIFHGAGEVIRGNVNTALDSAGDVIAGRPGEPVPMRNHKDAATTQVHGSVGQAGFNEVQQGLNRLQKK